MHLLHTVVLYIDSSAVWRLDHFTHCSCQPCFHFSLTSKDVAPFWQNLLVGQKSCDEELHLNGLFRQLIVLTLQCCCVPCASRQTNQWLLTVTHSHTHLLPKNCSFIYVCCAMPVLNLNSLLSNILNYWKVLLWYIWCIFHWLKLWSLQNRCWHWCLQVGHQEKLGNAGVGWGSLEDLERKQMEEIWEL